MAKRKKPADKAPTIEDGKVIRITCDPEKRLERMPVARLEAFQGTLKVLPDANFAELKLNLCGDPETDVPALGYSYPTMIWHGTSKILDGHQRNHVVATLLTQGYVLIDVDGKPTDAVPIVQVMADSEAMARRKVLAAVSQYGKISPEGLHRFLSDGDLQWDAVAEWVDLPDFDAKAFAKAFVNGTGTGTAPGGFADPEANLTTQYRCPKCSYEWSGKARTG